MSAGPHHDGGRVAIVGAGSIGAAWAIVFALAGYGVSVQDTDIARLDAVPGEIAHRIDQLIRYGLSAGPAPEITARIEYGTDLAGAVARAGYVQECVLESLEVKRAVFRQLDDLTPPEVVLASSSSMMSCSTFAAELPGRARCLVVHPGNPPFLLPVAEIVPAPFTDPAVTTLARELLRTAGMVPIDVHREVEGFVFNRLQGALLREAYCLVRDGVADPADIDHIVQWGLAPRWSVVGPFATSDLNTRGGLTRHAALMGPAYARMGAERGQHDEWTPELVARVAADVHDRQPLENWADHVNRRDEALMELVAARRKAGAAPTAE